MKILILEDNSNTQMCWRLELEDLGFKEEQILSAFSVAEAEDLFGANSADIGLIAVDACVPGVEINTEPFVRKVRARGFRGPMVAMSSSAGYRYRLMEAGCDYECEKELLIKNVKNLLAVYSQPVAV